MIVNDPYAELEKRLDDPIKKFHLARYLLCGG